MSGIGKNGKRRIRRESRSQECTLPFLFPEKPQMIIMHSAPINPGNVVYCAGTTRKSSESLFVRETPKQWTELHSEQEPTGGMWVG